MQCVARVTQNFGKNIVIVLDGYPEQPITKDNLLKSRAQSTDAETEVQASKKHIKS